MHLCSFGGGRNIYGWAKIKASAGSCKANLPPKPLQIEEEAPKAEADVEVIDFDGPDM